ncbi:hypothetical protein B0I72DRAFT_172449 [Yarrowia lipolytica]|nr:hypothetical protein B0I72DRAFT_172449 [Yarrowia lipolytica]
MRWTEQHDRVAQVHVRTHYSSSTDEQMVDYMVGLYPELDRETLSPLKCSSWIKIWGLQLFRDRKTQQKPGRNGAARFWTASTNTTEKRANKVAVEKYELLPEEVFPEEEFPEEEFPEEVFDQLVDLGVQTRDS